MLTADSKNYVSAKFYNWGVAEYNRKDYWRAEEDLEEALKWNPKAGWASFLLAQTSEKLERSPSRIEKYYLDATTSIPENAEYAFWTGDYFYRTGKYQDAKHWYLKAHAINPKDKWPLINLGRLEWSKNNNLEAAAAWYGKAIQVAPNESGATFLLGSIRRRQGRFAEAEKYLRKAISLKPNWHLPYYELALQYQQQKKYALAIPLCRKAIQLNPKDSAAYQVLQQCLVKLGRNAEAPAVFKEWQKQVSKRKP